jgi:hypothetical protein
MQMTQIEMTPTKTKSKLAKRGLTPAGMSAATATETPQGTGSARSVRSLLSGTPQSFLSGQKQPDCE